MATGKNEGDQLEKSEKELEDLMPAIRGIAKQLALREELKELLNQTASSAQYTPNATQECNSTKTKNTLSH
ncbi:MAG: hypothetical protein ACI9FR_002704 [Cryomorphaceae bacterium]|jgi:hypothetical protein